MSGDLTARDVIARAINDRFSPVNRRDPSWYHDEADHVLAALAAAGWRLVRADQLDCSYCGDYLDDGCPVHGGEGEGVPDNQWEWGVRWPKTVQAVGSEAEARDSAAERPDLRTVVRRRSGRPAGEWEVAPDA